ncbi:MAG: efflux RND transporter permease subunit [Pseudomonadota bacterium]
MNGIIAWFANNKVAANLIMIIIIVFGIGSLFSLNREFFPAAEVEDVRITVAYPGASPLETEDRLCIRMEEAVFNLDGVKKVECVAREGSATATVKKRSDADKLKLLNDVKSRIDGINTFPQEAERPSISQDTFRAQVISLSVYGDVTPRILKEWGEQIRDEVAELPSVDLAELRGTLPDEISIEISDAGLQRFGLTFESVRQAIAQNSINLSAGTIRSQSGNINLQTRGQAYDRQDFENIVLIDRPDGTKVFVKDVAKVIDGFSDGDVILRHNSQPAVFVEVFATANPNIVRTAAAVNEYAEDLRRRVPDGLNIDVWNDNSEVLQQRTSLLLWNALSGFLLVFLVLMLFLRFKVAAWVVVGIIVAFLGALWLLQFTGVSLNMISLFAFLMVLGIVVDDAIIVGEAIHRQTELGISDAKAAIKGTLNVFKPVLFAVLTTMIAFSPMLFVPGPARNFAVVIPIVVILCLGFSLLESLLILPSHLSHLGKPKPPRNIFARALNWLQNQCTRGMDAFVNRIYQPRLKWALDHRFVTIIIFALCFSVSVSIWAGGWLKFNFLPNISANFVQAQVTMPEGTSIVTVQSVYERVENAAKRLETDLRREFPDIAEPFQFTIGFADNNDLRMWVITDEKNVKTLPAPMITERWRTEIGDLPEAEEVKFSSTFNQVGKPISIALASDDIEALKIATDKVKDRLAEFQGVYDIRDSQSSSRREIELLLKPNARILGLTLSDLASQVRQAFFGGEAQRVPRGRDDVRVMVRLPEAERRSISTLQDLRIRTATGTEVPLESVAELRYVQGFSEIRREDRKRVLKVTADVAPDAESPGNIIKSLFETDVPKWQREFPQVKIGRDGDSRDQAEFFGALGQYGLLAIFIIYALLAIAFQSYGQPIIILTAIPFGYMGAIIGHMIMGVDLAMFSFLGIVAAAGVVVNDNLVLIDAVNRMRHEEGKSLREALERAGGERFRPIILTSLTTFVGLFPIMMETSIQAQFLIPMVISLGFGVAFATAVTLILVPALYGFGHDVKYAIKGSSAWLGREFSASFAWTFGGLFNWLYRLVIKQPPTPPGE